MRNVCFWLPLGALILLLSSCPTPVQSDNGGGGGNNGGGISGGSLLINLPLTDMQIAKGSNASAVLSYDVLGAGPGNASFQKLGITATSVTIDSLAPGDWAVTVNGINNLKMPITSTSISVTIVSGMTASAEVVSSTPVGTGTLDLSLTWTASPAISSAIFSLTPKSGAPFEITLPAIITNGSSSSIQATVEKVPEGFYTLSRVYTNSSSAVTWGAADALQVTPGNTTTLVMSAGDSVLTITPDISKAMPIAFNNTKTNFGNGEDVTITAIPSVKVRSYQWYLNGQVQKETSPTITFPGKTLSGSYRLDVVVSTKSGLSSNGMTFTVK